MYWRQQPPIEQASIVDIAIFLTRFYMNFWHQQISAQVYVRKIGATQVYSIYAGPPMIIDGSDKDPTGSDSETDILQKYYRYIMPPRGLVNNSTPPLPNKYHRLKKDIITQASLDPSSPFYDEYSPSPTPSQPPYATQVRKVLEGISWPTESISKCLCDQISWITNPEDTSESESSNKENVPPIIKHNECHCSPK